MNISILTAQGFSALARGDYEIAASNARRVLEQVPTDRAALTLLGRLALISQKPEGAIGYFLRVLEQPEQVAATWLDLAQAFTMLRDTSRALDSLEQALQIEPSNISALLAKGSLKLSLGEELEAARLFSEVLNADPQCLTALRGLCVLGKVVPASDITSRLERIGSNSANDIKARSDAQYALSLVYKKAKNKKLFIQHLFAANVLQRTLCSWDAEGFYRNTFARLDVALSSDKLVKSQFARPAEPSPIFILGMPRSGTTLVEQIIAAHQDVAAAGELDFMRGPLARAMEKKTGDQFPGGFEKLTSRELSELADLFTARIASIARDKKFVTDKTPGNYHILGLLPKLFPGCKVVHVRRDPVDTCFSILQQPFDDKSPHTCDINLLAMTYGHYRRQMEKWDALIGNQLLTVDYERLVTDTKKEAQRLFKFCGLEWRDDYLEFNRKSEVVQTFSALQVRQPIYKSSVGCWKQYEVELGQLRQALERELGKAI
ncbi:tetratricopeptide repeat-containing sulfotransferase family protein [Microbulbifer magnicolonia]|uniref:tetratricopeptide repeat-containing sulfotransferase family protein n=1 Tax=Microbulbifer magnicolonia TaxID=3109744 RepID=UPI002B40D046|nr:sulfotransferase [Microbulbifer sp. GG15]